MKILTVGLLAASLVLNAALLFFVGRASDADRAEHGAVAARAEPPRPPALPELTADVWPALTSTERSTQLARLRAAGFPADVIRAIFAAQLRAEYDARRLTLYPQEANPMFWKTLKRDPEREVALRKLEMEQKKALNDLLGKEDNPDWWSPRSVYQNSRAFTQLTPEKARAVTAVMDESEEQRALLVAEGLLLPSTQAKLVALERENHARLAQLLSPAELLDMDLQLSRTANSLREELAVFDATEEEFRSIFQMRQASEELNGASNLLARTREEALRRVDAQKKLTEQVKATLSPARAAEYERAIDPDYRQASQLIARLELPPETANEVWAVKQDIQSKLAALRKSSYGLSREQFTEQQASLADEAELRITAKIGERGFKAYKSYGGNWLYGLQPPAALPPPVK